jgi:hypothetical protein
VDATPKLAQRVHDHGGTTTFKIPYVRAKVSSFKLAWGASWPAGNMRAASSAGATAEAEPLRRPRQRVWRLPEWEHAVAPPPLNPDGWDMIKVDVLARVTLPKLLTVPDGAIHG